MMSQRSTDGSMYTDKVVILDPKYAGIEGGARVYVEIAPTLTSRDYKDPLRVIVYEEN